MLYNIIIVFCLRRIISKCSPYLAHYFIIFKSLFKITHAGSFESSITSTANYHIKPIHAFLDVGVNQLELELSCFNLTIVY